MTRIITLLVVSAVIGCNGGQGRSGGEDISISVISGINWQLTQMELAGKSITPIESSLVSFACTPDGEVNGSASINRYSGSVVTDGSRIVRWNPFRVTRMAGPPELMEQEALFLTALPQTTRMAHFGNGLIIENEKRGVRLEFIRPPD